MYRGCGGGLPGGLHRCRRRISRMEIEKSFRLHFQLRPFSPGEAPQGLWISGSVDRRPGNLFLTYILEGDLNRIDLPEPVRPAGRRHELWRRTCFEIFWARPGHTAYWEGNFSPAGDWNVYRFAGYRQGMAEEERLGGIPCQMIKTSRRLEFSCRMDIQDICPDREVLEAGIACVMLESGGRVSYWALDHRGQKADFHDRRSFRLQLAVPGSSGAEIAEA